jgi:hypothetical protein
MYEKRSAFFTQVFDLLQITCRVRPDGRIENASPLNYNGTSLQLYYNEATNQRGAYFAANKSLYSNFDQEHWLEARNDRNEPNHFKLIPYPGEELLALKGILAFIKSERYF